MRSDLIIPILTASFPTLAVLIGVVVHRGESSRIDGRITTEVAKLDSRLSGIENRLDAKIGGLEDRLPSDMMQVIGKLTELLVRVARLEEKQTR